MMKKAALVLVEGRQAVLLPDEFRFEGSEVIVHRDPESGDVMLSNKPRSWEDFFEGARQAEVPSDFMEDREQGVVTRDPFEGWSEPGEANKGTDGLYIARELRTAALAHENVILALAEFFRTPEFSRLRQAVVDGRMSFDDAVKEVFCDLALNVEHTDTTSGGNER